MSESCLLLKYALIGGGAALGSISPAATAIRLATQQRGARAAERLEALILLLPLPSAVAATATAAAAPANAATPASTRSRAAAAAAAAAPPPGAPPPASDHLVSAK